MGRNFLPLPSPPVLSSPSVQCVCPQVHCPRAATLPPTSSVLGGIYQHPPRERGAEKKGARRLELRAGSPNKLRIGNELGRCRRLGQRPTTNPPAPRLLGAPTRPSWPPRLRPTHCGDGAFLSSCAHRPPLHNPPAPGGVRLSPEATAASTSVSAACVTRAARARSAVATPPRVLAPPPGLQAPPPYQLWLPTDCAPARPSGHAPRSPFQSSSSEPLA